MQADANDLPHIYGDFNNRDPEGRVRLSIAGAIADQQRLNLQFVDGLRVLVDDHEEFCEPAIVRWSPTDGWVAELLDPKWKRFDTTGQWE